MAVSTTSTPPRLLAKYNKEIVETLGKKFGRTNRLSLPKLSKIVINMGVGKALQDKERMKIAADHMSLIAGQRAQIRKARVAVSGFRLRENTEIGCRVTLRGKRMYEVLDRLINIALPRVRDFRGVPTKAFDGRGNGHELAGRGRSRTLAQPSDACSTWATFARRRHRPLGPRFHILPRR